MASSIGLTTSRMSDTKYNMSRDTQLGIRLPAEVKLALAKAAKADARSMSSMVEKVMTDWLREQGYLKSTAGKKS
jgi:hypothetical protein